MAFSRCKQWGVFSPVMSVVVAGTMAWASVIATPAHASDNFKIAVVDMQKALQNVNAGKKAKSQLEREVEAKKKKFDKEKAEINKMGQEFKKQSLVMSDAARAKKQQELQERIMKLQQQGAQTEAALREKEQQLTQPILDKLRGVIASLAKKKGYSLVLEKSDNVILYSLPKDDLTQEVVNAYNKQNH